MSYTEPGQYDIKLKTPIDDHLEVGDQYELTMNKVNQSLGLNVTVSKDDCGLNIDCSFPSAGGNGITCP